MIEEKKCHGECGKVKSVSEFSVDKKAKSGFQYLCKLCASQYRKENREVLRIKEAQYRKNNPEYMANKRKSTAEWTRNNPDYKSQWYQNNKDNISIRMAKYYEDNSDTIKARNAQWSASNPDKIAHRSSKHRAMKLQRTAAWADSDKIKDIYDQCAEINLAAKVAGCVEQFVVDHVIPLQGKLVSGLHVEVNLDIITVGDNCRKSNNFIPG